MEKEFNLSVLENVLTFRTPLKECFDYDAIRALIKEEIDIVHTEDESEHRKIEKIPSTEKIEKIPSTEKMEKTSSIPTKTKKDRPKEVDDSSSVFKSPYRKKMCLKSTNWTTNVVRAATPKCETNERSEKRVMSVGRVKPGRSFATDRNRKRKNLISQSEASVSSDCDWDSAAETPKRLKRVEERVDESSNFAETNGSIKSESTCPSSSNAQTANDSFVESSQSTTTSSELRRRLNQGRSHSKLESTTVDNDLEIAAVKSEEDDEDEEENPQFSLTLSPVSKSSVWTDKKKTNESRSKNEKAICRVSPLKDLLKNDRTNGSTNVKKISNDESAMERKKKSLTQEIENCIRDDNYIEMCDSETETMSFTFETIQLLNDYENVDSTTNNKILKKILSSSSNNRSDENSWIDDDDGSSSLIQPKEDPLSIRDANAEFHRNDEKSLEIRRSTKSNGKKIEATNLERRERRSSGRTRNKVIVYTSASDWEAEHDKLFAKAARIAKKVVAAEKNAALSPEILKKLKNLSVRLRCKVLPQHEIENCAGSSALSYAQQQQFLKHATLNKGTYSPEEDKLIKQNWNDFCEDHDWDPNCYKPFLRLRHGDSLIMTSLDERRKFVQFLANGLPNRPLCSVYTRFRLLYNKCEAAGQRYTKKDDEKIIAYMQCHSNEPPEHKCLELARVMNRSRISIWKRYTKLVGKNVPMEVSTKVEWNLDLVSDLITTLLDVTLSDELIDLKDAFLPRVVWQKIETKMKIHHDVLQRFWERQLHLQLFVPQPIFINEIKIKLIECMHMKRINSTKEIKWDNIVTYFDGYTIPFLRFVFNHLKSTAAMNQQTRDLTEILRWLRDKKIEDLRSSPKDKCLPRISYVDKKAELVAEDLENARLSFDTSDDD